MLFKRHLLLLSFEDKIGLKKGKQRNAARLVSENETEPSVVQRDCKNTYATSVTK